MGFIHHPSPNFGTRRRGATPDLIVLHYTAMQTTTAALDRLCDPDCEVSAHYLISATGKVYQIVDESDRAWHAGAGAWGACTDVNSRSVGIELANTGTTPFSAPQMDSLERLLGGVMQRWKIPPERVIGHADMAPSRKADPGRLFDWNRLARSGVSVWPGSGPDLAANEGVFCDLAQQFGYPVAQGFPSVFAAFRLRFRPKATSSLDPADMGLIADLAKRHPVDQPHPSA